MRLKFTSFLTVHFLLWILGFHSGDYEELYLSFAAYFTLLSFLDHTSILTIEVDFHWTALRYIPEKRYCHCSFASQTRMHNVYTVENLKK
jgi:hypothetical protein